MDLPKYDEIIIPVLAYLNTEQEVRLRDFETPMARHFNLSKEQVEHEYESGNGRVFYDRLCWAVSYLNMAGLVRKPRRGVYAINETGKEQLKQPEHVFTYIQEKIALREETRVKKPKDSHAPIISDDQLTPEESLYQAFEGIKNSIYREILDTVLSKSPREFEKLVVSLLQAMGYGGEVENSGLVTQQSNDKGIDGIIKEDVLGLGRIHIQAKRYGYDNSIGREEIQKFVGALAVAQSNKGVFITTSSFSKGALEYARNLNTTTVALIDGNQLAEHMYNYSLGMQVEKVIEIKKLDSDFWDAMMDAQ